MKGNLIDRTVQQVTENDKYILKTMKEENETLKYDAIGKTALIYIIKPTSKNMK